MRSLADDEPIRWLPPLDTRRMADVAPKEEPGMMVLPLFPLGNVAYTPGSTQTLNIFEPRYRKMYNDILMSGSRRFVTTMVNPAGDGELAEVGVVLYLEDLKEVSQQTNDAIKYVCSHKVLDARVKIHAVLNPSEVEARATYMQCEVSDLADDDAAADGEERRPEAQAEERAVALALGALARAQESMQEEVRFSVEAVSKISAAPGVGPGTLWAVIELWKSFLDARAHAAERQVKADLNARLAKFLADKADKDRSGDKAKPPQSVNLSDLPGELQRDFRSLRDRVMEDVGPLVEEQTTGIQRLLQAPSHAERLRRFRNTVETEEKRLLAKRTLMEALGEGN
ncbi:hypothetical protein M885DRAFT_481987 [Pelagophyceae sp. CCMP2097]|nr:hypothetical protein M885DRAFT_481987 [Pelagophyceae sp. CCMP2097]